MRSHFVLYHLLGKWIYVTAQIIRHWYGKEATVSSTNLWGNSNHINSDTWVHAVQWPGDTTSLFEYCAALIRDGIHWVEKFNFISNTEFIGQTRPVSWCDLNKIFKIVGVLQAILKQKFFAEKGVFAAEMWLALNSLPLPRISLSAIDSRSLWTQLVNPILEVMIISELRKLYKYYIARAIIIM